MRTASVQLRRPTRRGGFTLLELLVAMGIVAILTATLYASLRAAFKDKAAAELDVEPPRTAALALDMIGADLQAAVAPNTLIPTSFETVDQSDDRGQPGDDVQLYSVADSPLHQNANGDIKLIELTTLPTPDGSDHLLVRKVTRNLLTQTITPTPDVEVICRGVGGFNLRYFDGTNWTDTWDSTQEDNTLPAAVEVTLTLDRPGGPVAGPGGKAEFRYTRVFPIPCSTAAQDSTVNPNATEGLP